MSNMRVDSSDMTTALLQSQRAITTQFGGDCQAQAAAMMISHSREASEQVRTVQQHVQNHLVEHRRQKLQAMRDQAQEQFMASCAAAFGQAASGVLTIAGGVSMAGASSDTAASALSANATNAAYSGSAALCNAAGQGVSAILQRHAAVSGISVTRHTDAAASCEQRLQDLRDEKAQERQLERTALDFLQESQRIRDRGDQALVARL